MEKLGQFYTAWENLGSSMIYEMKSDHEVFIDKTAEERELIQGHQQMLSYAHSNEDE